MTQNATDELINYLVNEFKSQFYDQNNILSFYEYLALFSNDPIKLMRNSAQYMISMILFFGIEIDKDGSKNFLLFEKARTKDKPPIVGQQKVHQNIYKILEQFVRQGKIDKLILLHGPNGSSKSSTAEIIARGLEDYSKTEEGAIYKFNWIFPNDRIGFEGLSEEKNKKIGFTDQKNDSSITGSFAHLKEEDVLCRIESDMKENPLFLIPKNSREKFLLNIFKNKDSKIEIPNHIERGSLSTKNKKIFDQLIIAYKGDVKKVFNHIQVERFYYSKNYRSGIAIVEPQLSIDAYDKQINYEKNIKNIPPILQNIRLFEFQGELIDANRGFIEYSDLLKRPLDAYKYLLTTIENMNIHLNSGILELDLIMTASTNEKHLDAFKISPDWASFKGRFELIRVPYLLKWKEEKKIYEEDVKIIEKIKSMGPHSLDLLCIWAILTRLIKPDQDKYHAIFKPLLTKLDPFQKLKLYDHEELDEVFSKKEETMLKKHLNFIKEEGQNSILYEGRFGVSPRELKMILYFASQNDSFDSLSALCIFEELEKFILDTTLYEFLQFEIHDKYHDTKEFIRYIKLKYKELFHKDLLSSLNFYDEKQYVSALENYLKHVIAFLHRENIINELTGKREIPNELIMEEIEKLISKDDNKKKFRENILAKIASWRVENPGEQISIKKIFKEELELISRKTYKKKEKEIQEIKQGMIMYNCNDYKKLDINILEKCETTFNNLWEKHGYTRLNAQKTLIFLDVTV